MSTGMQMVANKKVRDFLMDENIPLESFCKVIKDCLEENFLTFNGYNGLNELYINDSRLTLKESNALCTEPIIIVNGLRQDNPKASRIVRRGKKSFEAVLI